VTNEKYFIENTKVNFSLLKTKERRMTTGAKEQWEALYVESRFWRRNRDVQYGSTPSFDGEDQESIIAEYFEGFREKGGFRTNVGSLATIDHPLARFYRLFYTPEFMDFRLNTLKRTEGISRGVREMVIDQTFRYFVMVEANPVRAKRFGQVVMGLVVYRNMYDEATMGFITHSIRLTNKRLFNSHALPTVGGALSVADDEPADEEFENFEEDGMKLSLPRAVVRLLQENRLEPPTVSDVLSMTYGSVPMKSVGFHSPLGVCTTVYNPSRALILHVMHLITLYYENGPMDVIYVGVLNETVKQSIRDIIPPGVKFISLPGDSTAYEILRESSNDPFVLIIDQESKLVPGTEEGNDPQLLHQVELIKSLPATRTKAVSMTFRIPLPQNISDNTFRFCGGSILQVPWKNPKDGRMRLVWDPTDELERIYDVRQIYNMRSFHDYIVRPMFKFSPLQLESIDRPYGLVDGEFDSELEKFILRSYYDRFPNGMKTWVEIVDSESTANLYTVLTSVRFISMEKSLSLTQLTDFCNGVIDFHLSDKSNPLFNHALRVKRGGVFPTTHHTPTPLTESVDMLFGTTDEQLLGIYNTHLEYLESQKDLARIMGLKNIFPGEPAKDNTIPILKSLTPKFKELIQSEPYQENIPWKLYLGDLDRSDRRKEVNIFHLGDTLGSVLEYIVAESRRRYEWRIGTIFTYGTFDLNGIWKLVSKQKIEIQPIKDIRDIGNLARKSSFLLLEGSGMDETLRVAARDIRRLESYRGTITQRAADIVFTTPQTKSAFFTALQTYTNAKSCLVIGGEYEDMDIELAFNTQLQRIHVVVETGPGAVRVQEKMNGGLLPPHVHRKVFIQDSLARNFTPPLEGQRYDLVLCSPSVFARMFESRAPIESFVRTLCDDLLSPTGEFRTLVIDHTAIADIFHKSTLTENKSLRSTYVERFRANVYFPPNFQLDNIPGYSMSFKINSRQFFIPVSYNIDQYHPRAVVNTLPLHESHPFSLLTASIRPVGSAERAYEVYKGLGLDLGKRVREVNNFVKRLLIRGVRSKTDVLDLACGHGQDLGKWFQEEYAVKTYVGFDASDDAIAEARKRINSQTVKPRFFRLGTLDVFSSSSWRVEADDHARGQGYTAVSCQLAIHYAFDSERNIRTFMANVSSLLRMGGDFIVTTLDQGELAKRLTRTPRYNEHEIVVSGEFYRITLPATVAGTVLGGGVVPPGTGYSFLQFPGDPASRETVEYFVDGKYFIPLAEEMGLKLVTQANFLDYADQSKNEELSSLIRSLSDSERDMVGLYKVFHFGKTRELRDVKKQPAFNPSEFQKKRAEAQTQLARALVADTPAFKSGLVILPEETPVQPYLPNHEYEALHLVSESVTAIADIFSTLRSESVLNDRQRVFVQEDALGFKGNRPYDYIFLSHSTSAKLDRNSIQSLLGMLSDGGYIQGCFVDRRAAESLMGEDDRFSTALFSIETFDGGNRYIFDGGDTDIHSRKFVDVGEFETICSSLGCTLAVETPRIANVHREYLGLFRYFLIRRGQNPPRLPEGGVEIEDIPAESLGATDRFILVARPLKKAPGTAAGESIREQSRNAYRGLYADTLWRAKLSDGFEGDPIRMDTGETFKSVTTALMYYKCEFESIRKEPVEGYRALNLESGLPYPENLKPFSKAILGKLGREWKEREQAVLERVYTYKFTNTRGGDDPTNLSPLKVLLLTQSAELYSDSKTRNNLLEEIRIRIRNVYGNI